LSLRTKRDRGHWIAASALGAIFYVVHGRLAQHYLVPHGTGVELKLVGTGGIGSVATMMGFALPLGIVIGPVLWTAAVTHCRRRGDVLALGLLVVPLTGLVVARPYWGLVSLPAVVVFGTEGVADAVSAARRLLRGGPVRAEAEVDDERHLQIAHRFHRRAHELTH
jgi:hypothetical protein